MVKFDQFIAGVEQAEWDRLVIRLAPEIHEVDRQATRIWYAFWPLKLTRLLREADREAIVRDYRLKGNFELERQIDSAVSFLYGARFWPQVKAEIVSRSKTEGDSFDLPAEIRAAARQVAGAAGTDLPLALGITAVGYLTAAHLGIEALRDAVSTPAQLSRQHHSSPDLWCRARSRQSSSGLLGFLKGARRDFRVCADGHLDGGGHVFRARIGQDLSMASRSDTRDYTGIDPRRKEGPIPFECRSGSCGFCWVGILSPPQRLEKVTPSEVRRLQYFGYLGADAPDEAHPLIRLSCQTPCGGDTQVVVPPWNGTLNGRT